MSTVLGPFALSRCDKWMIDILMCKEEAVETLSCQVEETVETTCSETVDEEQSESLDTMDHMCV